MKESSSARRLHAAETTTERWQARRQARCGELRFSWHVHAVLLLVVPSLCFNPTCLPSAQAFSPQALRPPSSYNCLATPDCPLSRRSCCSLIPAISSSSSRSLARGKLILRASATNTNNKDDTHPLFKGKLPAVVQFAVVLMGYTLHLTVLTQHQIVLPIQWLARSSPSATVSYRHFVGMGWDSMAGVGSLLLYFCQGRRKNRQLPCKLPTAQPAWEFYHNTTTSNTTSTPPALQQLLHRNWPLAVHRFSFLLTTALLVLAYFATGRWSLFWEDCLYDAAAYGWPLTTPQFRAWVVLLGHLSWVAVGTVLLWLGPRAPRFFAPSTVQPHHHDNSNNNYASSQGSNTNTTTNSDNNNNNSSTPWHWFHWQIRHSQWWLWVLGGYLVSSWAFNVADWANHYLLPPDIWQTSVEQQQSVVSQLVAPEHNDVAASVVGYMAPCVTAPVWEEVLYRGFLLTGLTHWTGNFNLSAVLQAAVFSAHHMSLTAALPLFVLGLVWAGVYKLTGNLWTVSLIHALWNSRVFLGSWLGL